MRVSFAREGTLKAAHTKTTSYLLFVSLLFSDTIEDLNMPQKNKREALDGGFCMRSKGYLVSRRDTKRYEGIRRDTKGNEKKRA